MLRALIILATRPALIASLRAGAGATPRAAVDACTSSSPQLPTRRALLAAAACAGVRPVWAVTPAEFVPPNLDDVPPGAAMAYKQYFPSMQVAADFYVFELRDFVANPQAWDLVGDFAVMKSVGSAQSPSRLEREFIAPMRILGLAFPPDAGGERMEKATADFSAAMRTLTRLARASPGGLEAPDEKEVAVALASWEAGREALNAFYAALGDAVGANRMAPIPPKGQGYPRSKQLYTQMRKDAALCKNRGGETLAGLWGQLMVYATIPGVSPCGAGMAKYLMQ